MGTIRRWSQVKKDREKRKRVDDAWLRLCARKGEIQCGSDREGDRQKAAVPREKRGCYDKSSVVWIIECLQTEQEEDEKIAVTVVSVTVL